MKYTEEDYKKRCMEFDVVYVGFHKHKKHGNMIEFICRKHRDRGVQCMDWSHFRVSKTPCGYCNGRKRTTEDAQKLIKNKNIELISEYVGSEKPVMCKCNKCGHIWITNRPIDLFKRSGGCPSCAKELRAKKRRKTQDQFEKDLFKANPNISVIGKYKNTHTLIKCKCKIDGSEWESYPANLLNRSAGCPICNLSSGEAEIVAFMEKNKIKYIRQKTFEGCKDVELLRFDVYDIDNNIAIEFQGEQHYFPVDFSGNNPRRAEEEFSSLKARDNIKVNYCVEHGISLICIPYWERGAVGKYLTENIKIYKEKYIA